MTIVIDVPAEFGSLAELAASATEAADVAIVEGRLAAALAELHRAFARRPGTTRGERS